MNEQLIDGGYLAKRNFNPASFGAAAIVNGTILALLLGMAADIIPVPGEDPIVVTTVPTKPPETTIKPDPEKATKDPAEIKDSPLTIPPVEGPRINTENRARVETAEALPPPLPPLGGTQGPEIAPLPPPPQPYVPVKTGSSIDPRYRSVFQPEYPPGMIRAEREGSVTVRVLIGTDGRVKAVEAVRADDEAFLKATREHALRKWRFKPATEDGIAVESWREMTVRFEMPS